jgi:glycosyltransferase involved in cell wall biosynthesis
MDSPDFDARILAAEAAILAGENDKGRRLLEQLLLNFSDNARILNNLGTLAHIEGRHIESLRYFFSGLRSDPSNRTIILNLGQALEISGKLSEASELLFRYLDGKPEDREVLDACRKIDEKKLTQKISQCSFSDLNYRKRHFLVSVILPISSSIDFLQRALVDLQSQSISDKVEILLLGNRLSEDESILISEFQNRYDNIRYFSLKEKLNRYHAWNLALKVATGNFIFPFNTRDRLLPNELQNLASFLEAQPSVSVVYGDVYSDQGPLKDSLDHPLNPDSGTIMRWPQYTYEILLFSNGIGPMPMWRRAIHQQIGYLDDRYQTMGYYDFFLRVGRFYSMTHIKQITGQIGAKPEIQSQESAAELVEIQIKHGLAFNLFPLNPDLTGFTSASPIPKSEKFSVSALVSTYNSEFYFRGCLQSLVEQTLFVAGEMEILILDSGSSQNEKAIAQEYQNQYPNIIYVRTERESLYAAWNRMVRMSRSRYLVNANTDDRQRRDAFEVMAAALDERNVSLVYTDALLTVIPNESFSKTTAKIAWSVPDFNVRQALADCPFGCQVMWRRSVHDELGFFDEKLKIAGDYEFFLKASLSGGAYHIAQPLCLYFESMKNLSYGQPDQVNAEVKTFLPAIRKQIALKDIYPSLVDDQNPVSVAMAAMDFGNLLLNPNIRADFQGAEAFYLEAQKRIASLPELNNNLSLALSLQGKRAEASALLQETLLHFPKLAQYLENPGESPQAKILFEVPDVRFLNIPKIKFGALQKVPILDYLQAMAQIPRLPY